MNFRSTLLCALALVTLAGCGGGKAGSGSSASGRTDTLIWARGADSSGLDPAAETDGESLNVAANIFDGLVRFKAGTTEIEPALAKSWEISPDGRTYTFHLREGVKFHDGAPVDAAAVVFSLERQRDENHPAHKLSDQFGYWGAMGMGEIVSTIEATDSMTVRITLKRPEVPLLADLAMQFAEIVSPTAVMKYGKEFKRHPVGSGPWIFVEWKPDQRIVLDANPEYWDGAPKIKRVIWTVIKEPSARTQAYLAGNIDGFEGINPHEAELLRKSPNTRIISQAGMNVCYLAFNMDRKPFDDLKVRQALVHAVNRDRIIKGYYQGMAEVSATILPSSLWGHADDVKPYSYDPALSKKLLAEAGFSNGFETELWYMTGSRPYVFEPEKVAAAMREDFEAVGIRAKMVTYDWTTYLSKIQKGDHTMNLIGWSGDNGDPDNFLYTLFSIASANSIPAQNYSFLRDKELDGYLTKAKITPDQAARSELYKQAQRRMDSLTPALPIAQSQQIVVVRGNAKNLILSPDTRKRWELMEIGPASAGK